MTRQQVEHLSQKIANRAVGLDSFKEANLILLYRALPDEVQTQYIFEKARESGKQLCVPALDSNQERLKIYPWPDAPGDWEKGPLGIEQPSPIGDHEIAPERLDLILAPGLAFDAKGGRLGYGKGFFDRFFPKTRSGCLYYGLAFEFQVIDEVPTSPHDVAIDGILTPGRTIICGS